MRDEDDDDDVQEGGNGATLLARLAHGLLASPFLAGILCALASFFILAFVLPHPAAAPGAVIDVPVAEVQQETAPGQTPALPERSVAEMQAVPPGETATPFQPAAPPVLADAAVLVTDVGLSRRVTEAIDKTLPIETSLAVSVYAHDPRGISEAFKKVSRDVWLQIASQSLKVGIDPGPLALGAGMPKKENSDLLKKQLESAGNSVIGIYVPVDADITTQSDLWRDLALDAIAANKMVLDGTSARVSTELYVQKSDEKISAYLKTDITVDGAATPAQLQKALDDAVPAILKLKEAIIVIKNPTALAVETVAKWIDGLAAQGIRLVPASKFTGLKP